MIVNTRNVDALRVTFNAQFQQGFENVAPEWQKVAMPVPSAGKANLYAWLGLFPSMKEWFDKRTIQALKENDWTIKNRKFESTIEVEATEIEDDTVGLYGPVLKMMGDTAARHPDEMVFGLLAVAMSTLCYDGQYFCDTDHPVTDINGVIQSVSNYMGGSGNPWFVMDTSKPILPLIWQTRRDYRFRALDQPNDQKVFDQDKLTYGVDARVNSGFGLWHLATGSNMALTTDNFALADQNLISRTGDNGVKLALKSTLLVCGASNKEAALKTITVEKLADGSSNPYFKAVDVLITPYLP